MSVLIISPFLSLRAFELEYKSTPPLYTILSEVRLGELEIKKYR